MSVFFGIISAAVIYFVLEKSTGHVARQVKQQKTLEPEL